MAYNHKDIEQKWQQFWSDNETFKTVEDADKPKYYALDMFPYPSVKDSMWAILKDIQQQILCHE